MSGTELKALLSIFLLLRIGCMDGGEVGVRRKRLEG